jgi:hypothetical protein
MDAPNPNTIDHLVRPLVKNGTNYHPLEVDERIPLQDNGVLQMV